MLYHNNGLEEKTIDSRPSLVRYDFRLRRQDTEGHTNLTLLRLGRAPVDAVKEPHELHHIGQRMNSPLAELRKAENKEYYNILHDQEESDIDRGAFKGEREGHWKGRATDQ